jgi:hypothetical protein
VEKYRCASRQLDVTIDLEREVYPADRNYGFRRQPVAVLQPVGRHRLAHGLLDLALRRNAELLEELAQRGRPKGSAPRGAKASGGRGIAASIAVAVVVLALVVWGLLWAWHRIKCYRLAVGFVGLTVGFGIIRFISLYEVDAWNAAAPWVRTAVDLVAAAGVSTVAIARLCQLRNFCESPTPDGRASSKPRQRPSYDPGGAVWRPSSME